MISFFHSVREDVAAVFESDPAARSYFEVLTCYPVPSLEPLAVASWHAISGAVRFAGSPLLHRD